MESRIEKPLLRIRYSVAGAIMHKGNEQKENKRNRKTCHVNWSASDETQFDQ